MKYVNRIIDAILFIALVSMMSVAAEAQVQTYVLEKQYSVYFEKSLSAASTAVTIQQAAAGGIVMFEGVHVWCSVACVATVAQNGTAATATAATPTPVHTTTAARTTAYTDSNVGAGTTLTKLSIDAGGSGQFINLVGVTLPRDGGTGKNLTVSTDSITGDVRITVVYREGAY